MREVDLATFAIRHRDGAVVIDVREPFEYVSGHVPGAEPIPLSRLAARAGDLPHGVPVFVICATGNRSRFSAELQGLMRDVTKTVRQPGDSITVYQDWARRTVT